MKKRFLAIGVVFIAFLLAFPILHEWSYGPVDRGFHAYNAGNYAVALDFLLPVAGAGDNRAQRLVGLMYEHGQGVPQDINRAVWWYRKAANQDDPDGETFLGIMYAKGQGVAQDDKQAVQWFQKAANQGSARAYSLIGDMYLSGRGVQRDTQRAYDSYRKSVELYTEAAEKGTPTPKLRSVLHMPTAMVSRGTRSEP